MARLLLLGLRGLQERIGARYANHCITYVASLMKLCHQSANTANIVASLSMALSLNTSCHGSATLLPFLKPSKALKLLQFCVLYVSSLSPILSESGTHIILSHRVSPSTVPSSIATQKLATGSFSPVPVEVWDIWLFSMPLLWVFVSWPSVRVYHYFQTHDESDKNADTGSEKRDLCLKLGAEKWIDFKETKDLVKDIKEATGGLGPHSAVVTAASSPAYEQAIDYLRPGGTLMVVGLPGHGKLAADIFFTVTKSISILGSYVG